MNRADFGKPMKGKEALEFEDGQFQRELGRELKGAERTRTDSNYDIRTTGVKDDPFCHSANKVNDAIVRSSEKPKVAQDAQLHSDSTLPGEITVVGMNKGDFTESAKENVKRQNDKKVPQAVVERTFKN